jgi:hypothetical protein
MPRCVSACGHLCMPRMKTRGGEVPEEHVRLTDDTPFLETFNEPGSLATAASRFFSIE